MSRPDRRAMRGVGVVLGRVPFTLGFLAVMLVANALAGTFSGKIDPHALAAWGIGVDAIGSGNLLRFLTALFLSHDLPMLLRQLAFAAGVIGLAEWRWGRWRTAGLFFGLDFVTSVILIAAVALIPGLGGWAATTDVGMSMGGFGLIGVLMSSRRRALVELVAVLALIAVKYALAPDPLADGGHVVALVIGFCLGRIGPRPEVPAETTARTGGR